MRPVEPAVHAPAGPRTSGRPSPIQVEPAGRPWQAPPFGPADSDPRCDLCGGRPAPLHGIAADPLRPETDERWTLRWCERCELGSLWPRPSPSQVASFYEVDEYYTHGRNTGWKGRPPTFLDRVRVHLAWRADRGVEPDPGALRASLGAGEPTLCEVGCGNGSDLVRYAGFGFRAVGVEPDDRARETARERGLTVLAGTLESLPRSFAERTFDVVVVSHVLEHALDLRRAAANLRGLLAPTGRLVVEVPNHACLGFRTSGAWWSFTDAPRHLNFFTRASLAALFEREGLRPVETVYRGYCRQFQNPWIENERRIRAALEPHRKPPGRRRSIAASWALLVRTFAASPERKYDSVRMTFGPPR